MRNNSIQYSFAPRSVHTMQFEAPGVLAKIKKCALGAMFLSHSAPLRMRTPLSPLAFKKGPSHCLATALC